MNCRILQVLATLMSKTSFGQDSLNWFKPGGLNQGGQNLPTLEALQDEPSQPWKHCKMSPVRLFMGHPGPFE